MGAKIFISYRREDAPGYAGRIFDWLERDYGPGEIFMDVDGMQPGDEFAEVLAARVSECDVFLAVIGNRWIDACDEHDERRLDDPNDFVRIEVASALDQKKRVVPVLVKNARPPREHDLPESLRGLAKRHATVISHERFRTEIVNFNSKIKSLLADAEHKRIDEAKALTTPKPSQNPERFRKAYLSYAHEDRDEVIKRAQALNLAGIEFFADWFARPGEDFQTQMIDHIRQADVFLLFWSQAASRSAWVEKEIECALAMQHSSANKAPSIVPVMLEGPPFPRPPPMLQHLHFNDPLQYLRAVRRRDQA